MFIAYNNKVYKIENIRIIANLCLDIVTLTCNLWLLLQLCMVVERIISEFSSVIFT